MTDAPALTPPPGATSNFAATNPLNPAFIATAVLCFSIATASVVVRLATSLRRSNRDLRIVDFTCVLSWLGLLATCMLNALEVQKGLGKHQWDVPKSHIIPILRLLYINRIFYSPTILFAKLTILLQLMWIFVPTKRGTVYILTQSLIWSNVAFYIANVTSVIFQCAPIRKAWMGPTVDGSCVNTNLNLVISGSINVFSDILILLLPLWTIWHMNMSMKAKYSVSAAFGAGIIANFAGIARLIFSVRIINGTDLTYLRLQHGMWTIAEISTAIACASLPLLPQFIGLFRTRRANHRTPITCTERRPRDMSDSTTLQGEEPPVAEIELMPEEGGGWSRRGQGGYEKIKGGGGGVEVMEKEVV